VISGVYVFNARPTITEAIMRPRIFEFTLLSGRVVKIYDWNITTKQQALVALKGMFKFTPTIVGFYCN